MPRRLRATVDVYAPLTVAEGLSALPPLPQGWFNHPVSDPDQPGPRPQLPCTTNPVDDLFPAGLTLPNTVFTFTPAACGTVTKTSGAASTISNNNIRFSAASIASGASCQVSVNVTSSTAGGITNTTGAPTTTGPVALTGATATATLNVYAPPTVTKTSLQAGISYGGTSTLTITVTSPAANPGNLTGVAVDDAYVGTLLNNAIGAVACSGRRERHLHRRRQRQHGGRLQCRHHCPGRHLHHYPERHGQRLEQQYHRHRQRHRPGGPDRPDRQRHPHRSGSGPDHHPRPSPSAAWPAAATPT